MSTMNTDSLSLIVLEVAPTVNSQVLAGEIIYLFIHLQYKWVCCVYLLNCEYVLTMGND